jgi:hypothetical protein
MGIPHPPLLSPLSPVTTYDGRGTSRAYTLDRLKSDYPHSERGADYPSSRKSRLRLHAKAPVLLRAETASARNRVRVSAGRRDAARKSPGGI